MSKIKKKDFLIEVMQEIEIIKKKATPEEKGRLAIADFDVDRSMKCIYGLMTGYCNSTRARDIMQKKYRWTGSGKVATGLSFSKHSFELKNDKETFNYTALEKYLFMIDRSKTEDIINYIKGETENLTLK